MIGSQLGAYELQRELGHGGMGTVYRAVVVEPTAGLEPGRPVAIKVIHGHLLGSPGFLQRFLREAEIGRTIEHENVVQTHDCDAFVLDGIQQNFLVMEYVEGETLRGLLDELGRVPEELCRHIAREAAKGLAAIHEAGVIHRDLKPENVLITEEHAIKILDLGVARLQDEVVRLSQTGAFVGSLLYAAPEAFGGDEGDVDSRADLHGLGLLLYELATGVHPFRHEEVPAVIGRILHEVPPRAGQENPQLSLFFEEVVHRLLAKDREARFSSAQELAEILEQGEEAAWWQDRALSLRRETGEPPRRITVLRPTAVYGREKDLATLVERYEAAKAGDGQLVLVGGEAGIGKTRLLDELTNRLRAAGEEFHLLFGGYPPSRTATAADGLQAAFGTQLGAAGSGPYMTHAPTLVRGFDAYLRGEATVHGEVLTPESIGTCFVHTMRGLAAERPTLVVVDDLHFASEESRQLLLTLACAVPGHRVLLVATHRPDVPPGWMARLVGLPQTSRMTLARLPAEDLRRLLADAMQSETAGMELADRLGDRSDGNPFFVLEILRGLRETGLITRRPDGRWVARRLLETGDIPRSVLDLVHARIADLEQADRELLDVAACYGFRFDPRVVIEAQGLPRIPALKRLARLERERHLIRAFGREFVFDHHQLHEALYGGLPVLLREAYHAALGEALLRGEEAAGRGAAQVRGAVADRICHHLVAGDRAEQALPFLDAALEHLAAGYRTEDGTRLCRQVLEVPGLLEGRRRLDLLMRYARWLHLAGQPEELDVLEEARTLADMEEDPLAQARVRTALARHRLRSAEYDEAERFAKEGEEFARRAGDRGEEGTAVGIRGTVCMRRGKGAEAQPLFERHIEIAREIGDGLGEARALGALAILSGVRGQYGLAREHDQRALDLARRGGRRDLEATITGNLGVNHFHLGEYDEAQAHYEHHLALARELGDREGEARVLGNLGAMFEATGRYARAREYAQLYLARCQEVGYRRGELIARVNLGQLHADVGDTEAGREHFQLALDGGREVNALDVVGNALHGLARVAADAGRPEEASRHFEEVLDIWNRVGDRKSEMQAHIAYGAVLRRSGDLERARSHILCGRELAREMDAATGRIEAGAHLATLTGRLEDLTEEGTVDDALPVHHRSRMDVLFAVWEATKDPARLAEARRLLDHLVEHAPPEHRASAVERVLLHRDIHRAG